MVAAQVTRPDSEALRLRRRSAWLFLSPTLLTLAAVAAWPLVQTVEFGFTDATLDDLSARRFVGLENYAFLFEDPLWWRSLANTLWFAGISVALETVLGCIVALVLHARYPGRAWVRAAVLVPWAIPTVVSAKMWGWMLHDQFGVINEALVGLGVVAAPVAWTADPETALWAVVAVDVWKTTPFMALLILAGLQMVPQDYYEAARVDGLHPVVVFFRITLPLVWPALIVAIVFRLLDALRVFDLIYVLTANSEATMSMSVYARQQLVDFQEVGLGSAAATVLFLIVALVSVTVVMAARLDLSGSVRR